MAEWKDHLNRAIRQFGSQPRLAKAMGCSQSKISWLLTTAKEISAEDALAVHRVTAAHVAANGALDDGGIVTASQLRPDLWPTDEHVPIAPAAAASLAANLERA